MFAQVGRQGIQHQGGPRLLMSQPIRFVHQCLPVGLLEGLIAQML